MNSAVNKLTLDFNLMHREKKMKYSLFKHGKTKIRISPKAYCQLVKKDEIELKHVCVDLGNANKMHGLAFLENLTLVLVIRDRPPFRD